MGYVLPQFVSDQQTKAKKDLCNVVVCQLDNVFCVCFVFNHNFVIGMGTLLMNLSALGIGGGVYAVYEQCTPSKAGEIEMLCCAFIRYLHSLDPTMCNTICKSNVSLARQ